MNNSGIIFLLISVAIVSLFFSWYVFQAVKTVTANLDGSIVKSIINGFYWLISGVYILYVIMTISAIVQEGEITARSQIGLNAMLTVTVTQVTVILFLFSEDIYRGFQGIVNLAINNASEDNAYVPERRKFVSQIAIMIAAVPFISFVYGIIKGKYNFKVLRETLYFEDLPAAFDGFTITQVSDIHAGSFRDFESVQKGIDLVKAQKSDLFVFTGDLVNRTADEIDPLMANFKEIKAPFGQYSILGNHDYGDYVSWPSRADKAKNFAALKTNHAQMGYRLLLDEHVTLEKDGERIQLLGVENWGVGFKAKGNLDKALSGINEKDFKILLSHDPSHWEEVVKKHSTKIHLTLSGHTHGMQFGIETPLVRWSPAKYRYPNWAGLAEQAGRYLYVNRGFGFHAFSGRVGIWPEITVLTLKKKMA